MIDATKQADYLFLDETHVFMNSLAQLESRLGSRSQPALNEDFFELANAIRVMSRHCRLMQQRCDDNQRLDAARKEFQDRIAPWFKNSWFMTRAKEKPRGYPGDFELLNAIYDGQTRSPGLGGYLDLYFLRSDLGQAVVARMRALREFLNCEIRSREGKLKILNVACGPCREVFTGLEVPDGRRIELVCIDYDDDALKFVQNQLTNNGHDHLPELSFVQYNALRMRSGKANAKQFGLADVIYSIGLLDYLPDKHLVATLRGLRETLKPGGVAYFAFKDVHGYDPYEYQWFVDWFFFQRDEPQCRDLLLEAGFSADEIAVNRDETGIIMNFVATFGAPDIRRFDLAERPVRTLRRRLANGSGGVANGSHGNGASTPVDCHSPNVQQLRK